MRKLFAVVGLSGLSLMTSGCILFVLLGFEGCVDPISGDVFIGLRAEIKPCESYRSDDAQMVSCTNAVEANGSSASFSSFLSLIGTTGNFFLDPIVLQVPSDATGFSAILNDTINPPINALVQAGLSCVDTSLNEQLCAESGHQLVIFDIPPDAPPGVYQIMVQFNVNPPREIVVKPVVTGKVNVGSKVFYPVVVPCVTDMADAPGVTIPVSVSPAALQLPDLSNVEGCNGELMFGAAPAAMAPAASPVGLVGLGVAVLMLGIWRLRGSTRRRA